MKIAVIIKEVPDTEAKIELAGGKPQLSQVSKVNNPYDEYAIEEAIRHAEANPGSQVIAVFAGSAVTRKNVTDVLAMGADEAVIIEDPAIEDSDSLQIASLLAAAMRDLKPDYVLAGRQGVDYDWGITGIALAQKLGWAHAALVSRLEVSGSAFRAESEGDGGRMVIEGALPAVFTIDKGINEPRYPSLKGIMAAKKKPVHEKKPADYGVDVATLGAAASSVAFVSAELPPQKQAGRIIDGATTEEKVAKLIDALVNEAKVL